LKKAQRAATLRTSHLFSASPLKNQSVERR
jgi:hypothetical protein